MKSSECRAGKEERLLGVTKLWMGEAEAMQAIKAMSDRELDKHLNATNLEMNRIRKVYGGFI